MYRLWYAEYLNFTGSIVQAKICTVCELYRLCVVCDVVAENCTVCSLCSLGDVLAEMHSL